MLSSRRLLTAAVCIAGAMTGCQSPQSPQSQQPSPPALPAATPPPAPAVADAGATAPAASDGKSAAATGGASPPPVVSPAEAVARQAEQHAAAIEALLNARNTSDAK